MRPGRNTVQAATAVLLLATAFGHPLTASTSTTTGAATPPTGATTQSNGAARASAHVHTVGSELQETRPALSRAAVMAAARAAVAKRALEAARQAGVASARLALAAAAPALRGAPAPGAILVLGPVADPSEPRCANVTSMHYSLDMLLGTWYVVEVISPVIVGTVCDGFQLTKLNVSRAWEDPDAEAVIMSRFGRLPGGSTVYLNRTVLVGGGMGGNAGRVGEQEDAPAPMVYEQLAVTDYSPDGRFLSITACHEGEHWTYVYSRRAAPAAPVDLRALHRRLAAAGVATPAVATTAPPTTRTPTTPSPATATPKEDDSLAWWRSLPAYNSTPSPVFNVSECGW